MTLSQAALADALEDVFTSLPATASAAADALAQCYFDYAGAAVFGASAPTLAPALKSTMASTLLAAIAVPATGSPVTVAASWVAALTAFWIAVPVAGAQVGATVGCPGAAALTALSAVFANLANTAAVCAQAMAALIHTATLTVTAAVAPPPGTVLPIA